MSRVIVVDDEAGVRGLLGRWLNHWGYETHLAMSANDALEEMTAHPASIVLCDVMMPVHDGVWLAEQIRRRWPEAAVIMATGVEDVETVTAIRRLGAVAYVTKPLGREMVWQALQRAEDWALELQETDR
jgi:DNA-binding NtrC family response regulator